jgi:hypothetical protein
MGGLAVAIRDVNEEGDAFIGVESTYRGIRG